MNFVKSLSLVPVVVLALSSPALCQDVPVNPVPDYYLTGFGGAAVNIDFERPAAALGGEFGDRIHRDVFGYANLSFVDNLMSERMRSNLVVAGEDLTAQTGVPWEFTGRDRGLAFTMGAKYMMPSRMRFRPYVGGGFGVINLKRRISERDLGTVTPQAFYLTTGLNDGVIDANEDDVTMPLGEILLGFSGAAGRTYIDVAYRYRRGFHSFEPVEFSQFTFGVGVAFY